MQDKDHLNLLKITLEKLYKGNDVTHRIIYDPVEFPHRYKKQADIETAGFIASSLSYGRVELFKPVIERILKIMGDNPYEFVFNFDPERDMREFEGIKYRMNKTADIAAFIYLLSSFYKRYNTIGEFFKKNFKSDETDLINALSKFIKTFYSSDTSPVYGRRVYPFGLLQMLPSPDKGSACKRIHMFMRWMVRRDDGVDFGLWTFVSPDKLIIPLDTHIARISRHLGLTRRRTTDIKTAIDITNNLRYLDPQDPVKYDFALCHLGISGKCPVKKSSVACVHCSLKDVCIY